MTQSIENKQPDGPEPAQTTFTWEANHDCTDLTCRLPDGVRLMVWEIEEGIFIWAFDSPQSVPSLDSGVKRGLMKAMRAAQSAYLEHLKTTTP
jgi:hypothetical protein